KMQHTQHLALSFGLEIDQNIAAGNDIQVREGGIDQYIVRGENHLLSNGLCDAVMIVLLFEVARKPLGRHLRADTGRIHPRTRSRYCMLRKVRREYLDVQVLAGSLRLLRQQYSEGVR